MLRVEYGGWRAWRIESAEERDVVDLENYDFMKQSPGNGTVESFASLHDLLSSLAFSTRPLSRTSVHLSFSGRRMRLYDR